ncbi:DUF6795 domain-containing protein [Microbulbifer donghaiensis]|uniref:DUF6795 domain-containing protein n=1 Tax=Microbulbifer donghaiensis TaxID=494016 RepID=UPI003899117B
MYESSITKLLPMEFISAQTIAVHHNDQEYKIWIYAKRQPKKNFELDGQPIKLTCELSDP